MMKCLVLLVVSLLSTSATAQVVLKVVDGDTFDALWKDDTVRIRLLLVDAPESSNNRKARKDASRSEQDLRKIIELGKKSTDVLRRLLPVGSPVRLEFDVSERDRYGRLLAYVYRDSLFINEELIRQGMAVTMVIPPNVKFADRFRVLEATARREGRGHWKQ